MSITITADHETRRRAAALAAAMIEGDPRARLADFVDLLVGEDAREHGLDVTVAAPSLTTGDYRGRSGDLLAAVSAPSFNFKPRLATARALRAVAAIRGGTMSQWYMFAVDQLWREVCGPFADVWERARRAEAIGCAGAA